VRISDNSEPLNRAGEFYPRPSSFVRFAQVEDVVAILDLRGNAYHLLDEVASQMWLLLSGDPKPVAEHRRRLHALFDADPARIDLDFDRFVDGAIKDGLLASEGDMPTSGAAPLRRGPFPALMAWWCLAKTVMSLRWQGFEVTYNSVSMVAIGPSKPFWGIDRCLASFARAENAIVLPRAPQDCLPRSLALFRFLLAMGYPVGHRIGVSVKPFSAHAWVEFEGRVLSDADWRRTYAIIARLDP
jgi:hypothetical protein